jgi:6-pyruvoyltetrahydropterin/6-carboxytetrahydropterin synthase
MTNKVRLTRRVTFSSGHRYWVPSKTEDENRRLFGKWASPYNHGHNYILDVTTEGVPDPQNGMVVNIKTIDDLLDEHVVSQFDGKSINDEVEHFHTTPATLENLLLFIKDELHFLPPEAALVEIRLEEMPTLWANYNVHRNPPMTLTRSYEFAASHRLYNPSLSDAENEELFGKCSNPAGHGHNYILEVTVAGQPKPDTGMLADLEKMDAVVNEKVVDRYDHKNLNEDLPEFKGRMTTSEIVVQEIWKALESSVPAKLQRVRLQETARNIFEVCAE